jgi:hypothetical protein
MPTISGEHPNDNKLDPQREPFNGAGESLHIATRYGTWILTVWLVSLGGASLACSLAASSTPAVESPNTSQVASSSPVELKPVPTASGERVECDNLAAGFVTDLDVRQTPQLAEPDPRTPFRDPEFGTCLVRVTDRRADLAPDDASLGLKNEYSRVQSFNADGSRLIIRGTDATWYLYDAFSLQPLVQLPLEVDPRWDARDPNLIYFSDGSRLMVYDIRSGVNSVVHEFADDYPGQSLSMVWTRYEGSPSSDGRYWGMMAQDEEWQVIGFLVYDAMEDRVIAQREVTRNPDVDTVTISPLGNYFLAGFEHCERGSMGDTANPCGLMVYDRNLEEGRGLLRLIGHSDTLLDAQGREVLVYQDIDTDYISMLDLETGEITPLWPIDFSHSPIGLHFSGRATQVPGWALVSTYSGGHPADCGKVEE